MEATRDSKEVIPSSYRKVTVIRELELDIWKSVFEEAGEIGSFDVADLSYEAIGEFICKSRLVKTSLVNALKAIFELGDEQGRNLIEQAAVDVGFNLDSSDDESSRKLAARVWLSSQNNKQYLDVLNRAQVNFEYSRKTKSIREYVGEAGFVLDSLDADKVKVLVSSWCRENKKNDVVDVSVYKVDEVWCCNVVRGDPIKRVAVIKENRQSELTYRPAACDHIRIEPEAGRLGILTRAPSLLPVYREVFGELVSGDSKFFGGENICTLKPLQKHGSTLFENNLPYNVHRIQVSELRWRRGGRDNIHVRGKDCFRILRDVGAKLEVGELVEAKINFYFAGNVRPVRVAIKVPNRIEVPDNEYEDIIYRYLSDIGLRGRFDDSPDRIDFWSLNPWHFSESKWRHQIGDDFDTLKANGCFLSQNLEVVQHPGNPYDSGVLAVESVDKNTIVGISDDSHVGVRTLTPTDYEGYKLDISKIGSKIAVALCLNGDVRQVTDGLWSFGYRNLSQFTSVEVFFASSPPANDTAAMVQHIATTHRAIVIVPEGCSCAAALPVVYCRVTGMQFGDLLRKIVEVLRVQNEVEPPVWLPHDLILDASKNRVWYRGHEVKSLDASSHPFKFAQKVVEANGRLVTKEELNQYLSPSSMDDKVASKAKSDLIRKLRDAFSDEDKQLKSEIAGIFLNKTGGYALGCAAIVLP